MKRFAVSILLLATLHGAASAQMSHTPASNRMFHIGLGGGVSVPVSDAKDAFKNGVHGQGVVTFDPPMMPFGFRGSFNYHKFDFKQELPAGIDGSSTMISGLANLTFGIPIGPLRPYLTAGVGAFDLGTKVDSMGVEQKDSKIHFGINGGAGLEVKLGPLLAYVEGRMDNIYTDNGLSNAVLDTKKFNAQIIPVTFGIMY